MGLFSSSEFDELSILIEKATSEYIPAAQEDLALNLEITDIIKSKRVAPKDCLRLLLARLTHANPNVQLLTLQLLDKCVKNAGKHFLVELAGREFVDVAVEMMDDEEYGHDCNQMVQDRLIELFQEWALLLQSDPSLAYFYDTYTGLKADKRVIFPVPAKTLDQVDPLSIVSSLSPPEWNDSPTCQRCRDTFTMTNRKHHCRKCGGTFCHLCSSNETVLLEMGISDPVRVCDTCYRTPTATDDREKRHAKVFKKEEEDAELKKAIEMSLQEQQQQQKRPVEEKNEDEEALKRAIEASLKEVGPTHISPEIVSSEPAKLEIVSYDNKLSAVEQENIQMFHQLIGRLVRTRPTLQPEDVKDLKQLAGEMQRLKGKDEKEGGKFKGQLEEALKGFDLLFGQSTTSAAAVSTYSTANTAERVQSPPTSSEASKDLNQMRTELFGNPVTSIKSPELVRKRLGSMSLESQNNNYGGDFVSNTPNITQPYGLPAPIPQPIHQLQPQAHFHRHTQPAINHEYPQVPMHNPVMIRPSPFQATPVQMCPDLTIHPHPIHPPFSHENPYAEAAKSGSKIKDKKAKKEKKRKREKKEKKEEKGKRGKNEEKDKREKKEEKEKKTTKEKEKTKEKDIKPSKKSEKDSIEASVEKKHRHKREKDEEKVSKKPKKHEKTEESSDNTEKKKKKKKDKKRSDLSSAAEVTNLIDL